MANISFEQIGKTYGHGPKAVTIIQALSADIADGEFVVIDRKSTRLNSSHT